MNVCTLRRMIVAAGILALSSVAHAQDTMLSGVVTDSTGTPVAGAQVQALLSGPGGNADVVTDARGEYRVPVRLGEWIISVQMDGFATQRKRVEAQQISSAGSEGLKLNFKLRPDAAANFTPARTADGQVNISGYWDNDGATGDMVLYDLETGHRSEEHYQGRGNKPMPSPETAIVNTPNGRIPYQPWAQAERDYNQSVYQDPPSAEYVAGRSKCWLPGSPGLTSAGDPLIVQTPGYVIMSIEFAHTYRIIPLDGRPHVGPNIQLLNGDARGRWEGNTLVVDISNMKGQWLDLVGNFRTDAAHVVERWTLVSPNHLRYEATVDDPKAYTQPMKVVFNYGKRTNANYEFFEYACHEGNVNYVGRVLQPK